MKNTIAPASGETDVTESLLQSLIGECLDIIRTDIRPVIAAQTDPYERCRTIQSVVELVQIASSVSDSIARLRGGTEMRQRITVERVVATPPALPHG